MKQYFSFSILIIFCVGSFLLSCKSKKSSELEEQQVVEIVEEEIPQDSDQFLAYDVSEILTLYKNELVENDFINRVDKEIKDVKYEGYDIEYFEFHRFRDDEIEHLYEIFFSEYDQLFSAEEQEELLETSQVHEIHTWNSKKKELALVGEQLSLLQKEFGAKSPLFQEYKKKYIESSNVKASLTQLKLQKIKSTYTNSQKQALVKILGPLLKLQ